MLETKEAKASDFPVEIKAAMESYFKVANESIAKNEQAIAGVAKKFDDVVTREEQKKLDDAMAQLKDDVNKAVAELKRAGNGEEKASAQEQLAAVRALEAKAYDKFYRAKSNREAENALFEMKAFIESDEEFKGLAAELGIEQKTLSTVVAGDGGFGVRPEFADEIDEILLETSPMRQIADVRQIGTRELISLVDRKGATMAWVGELDSRPVTSTPTLSQMHFTAHEAYAYPEITLAMAEDATFDVEAWLADAVTEAFTIGENTAFVSGNGNGKPQGFLDAAITKVAAASYNANTNWGSLAYHFTGVSGGFAAAPNGADKLIDIVYDLKPAYRVGANWVAARRTIGEARKLKDSNGKYLIDDKITQSGLVPFLLGYPTVEFEDMPAIAANSYSMAFGNFQKGYQIVDRVEQEVRRDEITSPGRIRFHWRKRVGGGIKHYDAIKLLKFGTS